MLLAPMMMHPWMKFMLLMLMMSMLIIMIMMILLMMIMIITMVWPGPDRSGLGPVRVRSGSGPGLARSGPGAKFSEDIYIYKLQPGLGVQVFPFTAPQGLKISNGVKMRKNCPPGAPPKNEFCKKNLNFHYFDVFQLRNRFWTLPDAPLDPLDRYKNFEKFRFFAIFWYFLVFCL